MARNDKYQRTLLELDRLKFLYTYWNDAEKYELGFLFSIFFPLIFWMALHINFNLRELNTYAIIGVIILLAFLIKQNLKKYNQQQITIKEKIENLKI